MESQRSNNAEDEQCSEENSILSGFIKGVFGPQSVDNQPKEVVDMKNEYSMKTYEITASKDHKINSTTADLELHIQCCHKRIIEYENELKERGSVVVLLGDTLNGIVKSLKSANLQVESSNEDLSFLMKRVHSASELLSRMGMEEVAVVQSLTNNAESEVTQNETCDGADMELRTNEMGVGQCSRCCSHTENIAHIIKRLHKGFDLLQITTDFSEHSRDVDIASKIDCLATLAMQYKKNSEEVVTNLCLLKKENQNIQSLLTDKQTEVNSMTCHIRNLEIELKELKRKLSNLECNQKESSWQLDTLKDVKTDKATISYHDKDIQSVISMEVMDNMLRNYEHLLCESGRLTDNILVDRIFESGHNTPCVNQEITKIDMISKETKMKNVGLQTNPTLTCLSENNTTNASIIIPNCSGNLGTSEGRRNMGVVENEPYNDKFNFPGSQLGSSGVPEKSPCAIRESFYEEPDKGLEECVIPSENLEEYLIKLSSRSKELIIVKKHLEEAADKERKLQSQLRSVLDNCEKAEERCRKAENLAINLQNDFESVHRRLREMEKSNTNLVGINSEQPAFAGIVSPPTQGCDNNWQTCLSPELMEGLRDIGEEYLSSFLSNFWNKVKLVLDVNIPEDKTDVFISKKQPNLKSSLESDLNELALYLIRKCNLLRQIKLSIEAESRFHNLQAQVQKEVLNQVNIRSILNKESLTNTEERNIFINGRTRIHCTDDIVDSLTSLNLEIDCINSEVMRCLKYVMEKDFEKQSTELKMNFAGDVASMSHQQALELNNLKQELNEKIVKMQEKTEEYLENYKICSDKDGFEESQKIDLESMWNNLDENQRKVYDLVKERFERITAEQISIATSLYKENYDLKTKQEIHLLKSIHKQEIEKIKSTLEHQKLKELFSVRQELSKSHKESMNKLIQTVEMKMKDFRYKCQDLALKTSFGNAATLDQLQKCIISECHSTLKEISGVWLKEFEKGMENLEQEFTTKIKEKGDVKGCVLGDWSTDINTVHPQFQKSLVGLREILLTKTEAHFKTVAHWQLLRMKELVEKLQMEHENFKDKLGEFNPEETVGVPSLEKNDNKLLESKSECCSINHNICSLMSAGDGPWINEMHTLRKELEAKHAKEMESLRLYFEKKYAEVEKRYSEEVLTQRSKKCSHTGSSNSSCRTSLSDSDPELESDQFFLSQEEVHASRNLEDYERISLDMQLVGQDISAEVKNFVECNASDMPSSVTDNIELEAKIREELQLQFEEELQKRLAIIIEELKAKHEEDLKIQVAAEAKAYSDHIEEVTDAIKKCSEEEQEKFIKSHREMMDKFLMQHQKDLMALNELHDQELNALRGSGVEVAELKAEINNIKSRHNQELLNAKIAMKSDIDEASKNLIQNHTKEITELKERLQINHKEEVDRLQNEIKRKEAYCKEIKCLGEAELEEIKGNFEERLQYGIEKAKQLIIKSLEEQIQALLAEQDKESGNMIELVKLKEKLGFTSENSSFIKECQTKESNKEVKDDTTKVVPENSEWSNPVLLEQRVDKLKQGIESDFNDRFSKSECMGRDLLTLKLQVNQLEQSKNVLLSRLGESDVEMDDATSITILHTDLDKLLKDRDKWKKVSQTLKTVLLDVIEYTHSCEEELNSTIVQSIFRFSGVSSKYGLSEDNIEDEDRPRRVHFAPDVVTNIFGPEELEVEGGENVIARLEESSEEMRVELKQCLGRLRAEASALLGLSTSVKQEDESIAFNNNLIHSQQELMDKITLLENHLREETAEKDRLKVELHTTKGLVEGHITSEAALVARATLAETQLAAFLSKRTQRVETIAEGFGESSESLNFNRQLQKLAQLREKARWMLKEHHSQGENISTEGENQAAVFGPLIAHLIEELCSEGDRLSEEARREREDLQLQVEAADKQLRCTRAFLEEQTIEREQEREEFQKELNRLNEALGGREREKGERERMAAEVEALEQQSKELIQMLKETTEKKEELETELKAAIDKIWDLREIIRELEGQVEGSLLSEKNLQRENEQLIMEMSLQSKKLDDLIQELELLHNSLGYSMAGEKESESHTALLEKVLRKHCLQVEQAKAMGPALKDMKKQLLEIGSSIDRKTKELEALQVTPLTSGNCISPSEDVSVREQLEQATWRSESPIEDEDVEKEVPESNEAKVDSVSTPFWLPKVPLPELHYLQEKFIRHSQAQEPLLKRIHDLEMQIQSLRHNEEELITEREVLQSQVEEQLLQASELQARLDEARRRGGRHNLCMAVTPLPSSPLSHSPIGSPSTTPDQPSFCCVGLVDARYEIEKLTECLEKKELEVTQLKSALENSKKVVASQENELTNRAREEAETLKKIEEFEKLRSEKEMLQVKLSHKIKNDDRTVSFSILLDALLAEKNEEIDFLGLQLANLKDQLSKVLSSEEVKAMDGPSKKLNEKKKDVEIPEKNRSSNSDYDEVEVLRECPASDLSLGRADVMHADEFEGYRKMWFHSTKIDTQNSPSDSPGLCVSPLTPNDRKHIGENEAMSEKDSKEKEKISSSDSAGVVISSLTHRDEKDVVISEPSLKEESLEEIPPHKLSYISDSNREKKELSNNNLHDVKENKLSVFNDAEIQTDGDAVLEDLKMTVIDKEEEILALKNEVDGLEGEKDSLSLLIAELRKKIDWHSKHLEKYEEERLSRDAIINEIQTRKKDLKVALQKSGLELAALQSTHAAQQEKLLTQEELIKTLNEKVEKYSKANKDQHMLLKAAQQERKEIIAMITNISLESIENLQDDQGLFSPNLTENKNVGEKKPKELIRQKLSNATGPKLSMRELVSQLICEVKSLRINLNNLIIQKSLLKEDLEKAAKYHSLSFLNEKAVDNTSECGKSKKEDGNQNNDKFGPISLPNERGSSPSLLTLEQMMEQVQKEGIEVLSLSEIAAGRRSTSGGTPIFETSPLESPKSVDNASTITGRHNNSVGSLKTKAVTSVEDERMKLIMRVQSLENELSSKEREEMRKRDWLEFQEKEGYAGWTGVVETVGQKHRHELNILEQLGEQRNARARLEAEILQLHQQYTQAESEIRKVTYRLGMERSHVIRLESALQQEKSNFSQLQVSLDSERRRANMTKQLNAKVIKTLQSELAQYQAKVSHLQKSLKHECKLRLELEARLKPMQHNQSFTTEGNEEQRLQFEAIANEESLQLKKIEEDCERKALEQELEDEKQNRSECQQEIVRLRNILETRQNHETYAPVDSVRWSHATSPSTPYVSESSFNAEDMLQNLKGINQVLGWHIRQREDYIAPDLASAETEKHYLEAKCCHLEQKLITIQDVLTRERAVWANERSLLLKEQQYLLEMNGDVPQNCTPKELKKFQDLIKQLYSLYWRSERNRKALSWQKRYFLSVLSDYRNFKVDIITELSKVTDEQRIVVDKITGSRIITKLKGHGASSQLQHPRDGARKSFRVLVWTVIATLKMKVLVLRSMTGIRVGCQSLLEDILQPVSSYSKTPYHHQLPQQVPSAVGTSEMPFHYDAPSISSTSNSRKSFSVVDTKHQHFP